MKRSTILTVLLAFFMFGCSATVRDDGDAAEIGSAVNGCASDCDCEQTDNTCERTICDDGSCRVVNDDGASCGIHGICANGWCCSSGSCSLIEIVSNEICYDY